MATLPVYDRTGASVGSYEIDPAQIAPRISKQLLHDAVVMYQNNERQDSSNRELCRCGGHDEEDVQAEEHGQRYVPVAQRMVSAVAARHDSRHSAHAIGPIGLPHYCFAEKLRPISCLLASRIADNEVVLIDQMAFTHPKTKEMAGILKALKIDGKSVLVAMPDYDSNVYMSGRSCRRRHSGAADQ